MAAKASGAPGKQQRLQRLIECPVCLNELQDPRLLTCRHTLCYTCLKDYKVKNEYVNELPCPVCRQVTTLYRGGVDNLPKFFFMNELKEVVMEEEGSMDETQQKPRGVVCSAEDCEQVAVTFCTKGCEFLCQQCLDEHSKFKRTKSHQVIGVDEGKELELESQGAECKIKLEQTSKDTERLIDQVKQVMVKTKQQAQQAEIDLDNMCENVKSAFKAIRDNVNKEEMKMLLDIENVRKRVQKIVGVTTDSQMIKLATLENLKSCQVKLAEKNRVYDYVTATESIHKDVESHVTDLLGFMWNSKIIKKSKSGEMIQWRINMKQTELTKKKQEEIGRIILHNPYEVVLGMVVYKERVYVVHCIGLVVYCYNPDGSLSEKYEHEGGTETVVQGMCMIMHGGTARLVVSDLYNKALVWITISDSGAMKHHHTQQVEYWPRGSYNDRGHLVVCAVNHKIHRYTGDGQPLSVTTLTDDVKPDAVTRHGDGDHYVVTDLLNHQVAVIDEEGHVKRLYKDNIQGVKLNELYAIATDKHGRILVVDNAQQHVLQISKDREEVKQLLQGQVKQPMYVCLDDECHKMYVSATDMDDHSFVFVYDYNVLNGDNTFTEKITKLDMVTVM